MTRQSSGEYCQAHFPCSMTSQTSGLCCQAHFTCSMTSQLSDLYCQSHFTCSMTSQSSDLHCQAHFTCGMTSQLSGKYCQAHFTMTISFRAAPSLSLLAVRSQTDWNDSLSHGADTKCSPPSDRGRLRGQKVGVELFRPFVAV